MISTQLCIVRLLKFVRLVYYVFVIQGCPQYVKSQDRDETETLQKRIETAVSQFKNTNW